MSKFICVKIEFLMDEVEYFKDKKEREQQIELGVNPDSLPPITPKTHMGERWVNKEHILVYNEGLTKGETAIRMITGEVYTIQEELDKFHIRMGNT